MKSILAAALIAGVGTVAASAQWTQGGERLPETPWCKQNGPFGAMLLLTTEPDEFVEEWRRPDPSYWPKIETVETVERGTRVVGFVIFSGCQADREGLCSSGVDFSVLRPDGSEYSRIADVELWKGKPAPAAGILQLSVANLALVVEPSDPLGTYVIKARVCDFIADRCVDLEQRVEAEDGEESSTRADPSAAARGQTKLAIRPP